MSTKIYNGYELPNLSLLELKELANKIQKKINQKKDLLVLDLYTQMIIEKIDARACNLELSNEIKPLAEVNRELMDRVHKIKKTNQRDPLVDFESSATFIPLKDKTLALFYCENQEFTKIWESFRLIKDYHYQNSTDKPKEISTKEWKQRKKDWDTALKLGYHRPMENGFSIHFSDDYLVTPTKEEILNHCPNFSSRVKAMGLRMLRDEKFKANPASVTEIWSWFSNHEKWIKSEEGIKELEAKEKLVELLLNKNLTVEDLI